MVSKNKAEISKGQVLHVYIIGGNLISLTSFFHQ